jgi:sulfite exporter TauE/SafE
MIFQAYGLIVIVDVSPSLRYLKLTAWWKIITLNSVPGWLPCRMFCVFFKARRDIIIYSGATPRFRCPPHP